MVRNDSSEENERLQREIAELEVKLEPFWGVDTEELTDERMQQQVELLKQIELRHAKILSNIGDVINSNLEVKNGRVVGDICSLHRRINTGMD